MTTRDKTGDKLIASIRKTKADAAPTQDAHAAAKPGTTKAKATRPARRKAAPKKRNTQPTEVLDPYRSAGRVWPD